MIDKCTFVIGIIVIFVVSSLLGTSANYVLAAAIVYTGFFAIDMINRKTKGDK